MTGRVHEDVNGNFEGLGSYAHVVSYLCPKNSGHLWLAYTELQGSFNMLQLISVDSGHFTRPELWLHIIKEPSLRQYQVRIWACSGTTSYPKGSWAVVD